MTLADSIKKKAIWFEFTLLFHTCNSIKRKNKLSDTQKTLCIFDVFTAQMSEDFRDFLDENNVKIVYLDSDTLDINSNYPVDMSLIQLKPLTAKWLVKMFQYKSNNQR
ncbi:hypothetical protein KUTeg_002485 [Tegillarca granosa]|uniref:Uncharacterized protein n=1 Tax=Tegillarca granosa TaxID=220873 RepID=A0ABQ9FUF5_TEGGR|nr:hypothetical protein KUTeg_002485 [Tegillarca granosa]